jgi:hypothetical protein
MKPIAAILFGVMVGIASSALPHPIVSVGYELEPGRITYWSPHRFRSLRQGRYWANRLNRRGNLPGVWVVRT